MLTGRRLKQFVIMHVGLPADIRSLQYSVLVCLLCNVANMLGKKSVIAELIAGLSVSVRDVM